MKKAGYTTQERFLPYILPAVVVLVWFLATELGDTPNYVMPSPKEFLEVFWDFIFGGLKASPYSGKMLKNLIASGGRVMKGFALASVLGIVLGFLTGRIACLRKLVDPTVQALRSVPGIGYLPLGMVWFGVGEGNTMFLISLAAFFPVYLNTQEGAARVPELYLRAGRMLGHVDIVIVCMIVIAITGKLCDWCLICVLRLLGRGMIEGNDHGR